MNDDENDFVDKEQECKFTIKEIFNDNKEVHYSLYSHDAKDNINNNVNINETENVEKIITIIDDDGEEKIEIDKNKQLSELREILNINENKRFIIE